MRIYGLDILRASAILLVVYTHLDRVFPRNSVEIFDGVGLFFVLSGYLIGGILIQTFSRKIQLCDLLNFWIRRWLRTLPAYYFVLFSLGLYGLIIGIDMPDFVLHIFFLQGLNVETYKYFLQESWSLCVEEWFYFFIPIVLFVSFKFYSSKYVILFWAALIILLTSFYRVTNVSPYVPTIIYFDGLMWGFIGAYLSYYNLWKYELALFRIGIVLIIFQIIYSNIPPLDLYISRFIPLIKPISILLLIPKLSKLQIGKGVVFKMITFISTISYSMYLLNLTPMRYFFGILHSFVNHLWVDFIAYFVFTFGGAYLLNKFIEKPFMGLRDKIVFRHDIPQSKYS